MGTATLDISEARRRFNSLDTLIRDERVVTVTRHNRRAFALIDLDYLEAVTETLDILADVETISMLEQSVEDMRAGRVHDHEAVKRDLL